MSTLLDYYSPNDPTSALSELHDLGAVDLSYLAWTSVRGLSALSQPPVTVFDDWDTQCPTPRMDRYLDRQTGEIIERVHVYWSHYLGKDVDAPCNRNCCRACAVRKARKVAGAIFVSKPSHVLTLTQVGTGYQDIRKRLGRFFDALRRTYPTLRYLWTAESNPAATGCARSCVCTPGRFLHQSGRRRSCSISDRCRLGRHHAGADHGQGDLHGLWHEGPPHREA